jgi:damage-control phosphatase, subfamily I
MKVVARCVSCILDDLVGAMRLLGLSEEQKGEIVQRSLDHLQAHFRDRWLPSRYITDVHRILKEVTGLSLPFAELRQKCNEVGVVLAERCQQRAAGISDDLARLVYLARWSIAGNTLDFRTVGTGYEFTVEEIEGFLTVAFEEGLEIDHLEEARALLPGVRKLLFVHDNVGEIAFDRILIEELRATYGCHVVSALRGGPITSDATLEDGTAVGLDKVSDEIILACGDTLGVQMDEATPEFLAALETADLIIAKGQANFYLFHEMAGELRPRVLSLLTTKCRPVAGLLGKKQRRINVAYLFPA